MEVERFNQADRWGRGEGKNADKKPKQSKIQTKSHNYKKHQNHKNPQTKPKNNHKNQPTPLIFFFPFHLATFY